MTRKRKKPSEPAAPPFSVLPTAVSQTPRFLIVGLGASAGGLAAFENFFSGLPADRDPDMAFVLVQHLDPQRKSLLVELVRRFTRLAVCEVEDAMVVKPNCVYIIPPNYDLSILHGALQLLEPTEPRGHRLPIDHFFNALAEDQRSRAVAIVLSGTGSDGSRGLRSIKNAGGLILVQHPASCEYDGMPCSAIATGLADAELSPAEMPAHLIAYAATVPQQISGIKIASTSIHENELQKIFVLLRAHTKHDFSLYKRSTINRRIERRMAVQKIEKIDEYVRFLQVTPAEVTELFRDFLIGVTNFFRDPEAFAVLETQTIPAIFTAKPAGATIRVWSVGCSTGEEAYSLAILLHERAKVLQQGHTVQLFASDIDPRAIATARAGRYPSSIAADLSPQRLTQFFIGEPDGLSYRVQKNLREIILFSEHDMIKDPPFSKIDLLVCRNVLIYFSAQLQKMLIPLFHFALNPGGSLFLGTSEGIGDFDSLFVIQDRTAKIYQCKSGCSVPQFRVLNPTLSPNPATLPHVADTKGLPMKIPLRELTEQALLQHAGLVSVLVNANGDVLYLHGRTGMYLEPAPGEAGVSNIVKMAREGLLTELTIALRQAVASNAVVRRPDVRVKTNGHFTTITLTIRPLTSGSGQPLSPPFYLVIMEEVPPDRPTVTSALPLNAPGDNATEIAALAEELRRKDEFLRATQEELESSAEELKSANEEMQSVNEELQSTNEELETSKEEQQSINEELATVNSELQGKVSDLSRINNDMNNLLSGTGIATIFIDRQLNILRFTPNASLIINLIPSDVGRPVAHIVSNLVNYDRLVPDVQMVLDTLVPKEIEMQTVVGKWYTMRMQPYRTMDNHIEGVVLTFTDITETKLAQTALLKANDLLRLVVVVRDSHDAITVQDLTGKIIAWNPGAERLYGWSEAEALQMNTRERIPPDLRKEALAKIHDLGLANVLEPYRTQRLTKTGTVVDVSMISTALINTAGEMYATSTTERKESFDA